MKPLDRKLLRDLWRLRGQVIAIAFIIASGVGVLVMSLTALEALVQTSDAYYERYRFAQVFANVKRAPEPLARRIADLPGVQTVETRIIQFAILDVEGFVEPVIGHLVSVPERGQPVLNRLALRSGRWISPGRVDEVIVGEPFAEAHGLTLGDSIEAIMNGNKRRLTIVGTALSPEFVYAIGPGALMPDDERYGILWMGEEALAAAYDLDGAFNEVSLSLLRGVNPDDVIDRLDQILARYGGVGAYARADQISNWFLMNELEQLRSLSSILPTIFLSVAAFLTNMVLARLIAIERSEIGLLKAFGYSSTAVAWHYAKMVLVIGGLGILLGWVIGYWLGLVNTTIYSNFYRFPFLYFRPGPTSFAIAGIVSLGAAMIGALGAVAQAARLSPAAAMQPPAPPAFHKSAARLVAAVGWLDQPTRMILRQIFRWPLRSFLTMTGISMAVAVLVTSMQWIDSIDRIIDVYFHQAQRQDVSVALVEPEDDTVIREFAALPGVLAAEPARIVTAKFIAGTREHRGSLHGVLPDPKLELVYDAGGTALRVPPEGLVMSTKLAEKLDLSVGDTARIEVLEGRRPTIAVPVVQLFETYMGMPAYMDLDALNRLLMEPQRVEYLSLLVDERAERALFAELKEMPEVAAVMLRRAAIATFQDTMAETLIIYVSFFVGFSCTLAFGVVYNSARIGLSERGRELATLRVLGFRRWEVSYILLGETGLLIFVGLPFGCLCGGALAWLMISAFETELYRVPLVIDPSTFGTAVLIALAATLASGLLVRRRLDSLDLIGVLKTRE